MINYMQRDYFENDVYGFYSNNMNIDCCEQMEYQSLRNYNTDYYLVFCNDTNITYCEKNSNIDIIPNDLKINDNLFDFNVITESYEEVDYSIQEIIKNNKIVIFQTVFDKLKTYVWYHENGEYTKKNHNAIIIGYDNDYYFYVDSPPTRNKNYFESNLYNSSVGKIKKEELILAMKIHCKIGYINIFEEKLLEITSVDRILKKIIESYLGIPNTKQISKYYTVLTGRVALEKLIQSLQNRDSSQRFFADPFDSELICSRHKILEICLKNYKYMFCNEYLQDVLDVLGELINYWKIVNHLIIKQSIKPYSRFNNTIIKYIKIILIYEDKFIEYCDKLF